MFDDNLAKCWQLSQLMFLASVDSKKKTIQINEWRANLERLYIIIDDMRGAYYSR